MSFSGLMLVKSLSPVPDQPNTYRVGKGGFIANEVTVTVAPSMKETSIEVAPATAEQQTHSEPATDSSQKQNSDQQKELRRQQQKLDEYKLMLLRPGKVSVQGS